MTLYSRIISITGRLVRGEDITRVLQSKEQWDAQFEGGAWDRLIEAQPNTALIAEMLSEYAAAHAETYRVLDVGCGNGGLAIELASRAPGISYTGTDISDVALTDARRTAPAFSFRAGDANMPPRDLGSFDAVVFNEVLYYLEYASLMQRYRRHSRQGGIVIVSLVRTFRSPYIWFRIGRSLATQESFMVQDAKKGLRWDVRVCVFRK